MRLARLRNLLRRPEVTRDTPPWEAVDVPDAALRPPTMLSVAERRLLYWLGASHARGEGAIVDAGSFVGGSTVARSPSWTSRRSATGAVASSNTGRKLSPGRRPRSPR